ncbi:MAG: hypothetical protein GX433_04145 [Deltaproteobacteria bacterium]|nr:hypothetical protein [Deltaproteobacteria bacterium]
MNSPAQPSRQMLWLNGCFLPLEKAAVSPLDRGFLYGDGLFETMRAENGRILFLKEHTERLQSSMRELRIKADPFPPLDVTIGKLLHLNSLSQGIATVKIIVTRGDCSGPGLPMNISGPQRPTRCITAQKYSPPSPFTYEKGWKLHVFGEGYAPPLAMHKSLNYLYHLTARQSALDAGADEALLLDPYGNVTETSAGSLLLRTEDTWWTPANPHQLPGITLHRAIRFMENLGRKVEYKTAGIEKLTEAKTIWILNSLMLVMPVYALGNCPVEDLAANDASRLRNALIHLE